MGTEAKRDLHPVIAESTARSRRSPAVRRMEAAMLVGKRMKSNPITVGPHDSFRHAMNLIRQRGIRHLPVLDSGRLVGIVTDRDIRQASPSPATSLEMHELHYLLEKVKVCDVMTAKVITVTPDTPIACP